VAQKQPAHDNGVHVARKRAVLKVVNLEEGRPTLERARLRLHHELHIAQRDGCAGVKLIHGYGSSGVGGALREGIQATLRQAVAEGRIAAFIAGEDWRISDETSWSLLKRFPEWKQDHDLNRGNKGISVVVF
jgi:hypothetical protein